MHNMSICYYELADNRYLGMSVFEISSFPGSISTNTNLQENCEKIADTFQQILSETHRMVSQNVCMELLWLTEKTENQIFRSKIRIFGVLRKLGSDKESIAYMLENIKRNYVTTLSAMQFGILTEESVTQDLMNMLGQVDDSCVYSVVKSERCLGNANSIYPYYFCDVIPGHNVSNFNGLISGLSQQENCCVSFQLFPVQMTTEEITIINEVAGELGRITSGMMINRELYRDSAAGEPLKAYNYYNERRNEPYFLYNILVFGERACCASLATKVISHLQSGKEQIVKCDPICIDLTSEKINLDKQFPYYVWNVNTRLMHYYRNKKIQAAIPLAQRLFRLPYMITAEEAASFYRLPLYEKTMTALKNNQVLQAQEQFAKDVVDERNIQIGRLVTNDSSKIMIGCPEKSFTKHALVVGTPGSGKTTFSVNLLLQFARRGIPFLAIEPTKTEYRAMIDALPKLQIFTPGNNAVCPFVINPFIPPKGIRIEQYIPSLASAFKAAFSMPSPLDMIFLKAIRTCYMQYGWKDYSIAGDPDVTLFGLHEFIIVFQKLLKNTNYSKEVKGNLESAGLLRLSNLIEQNSNIYDSINTVPIEDLLTQPTVLELNAIDNAEQKSLIIALLLINICLYTKHNHVGDGELKNAILIDEAHVLLGGGSADAGEGSPNSQATTVKALQDMIAEIRSYGTSIIIADQSPTKVSREVVANTDIKVSFRLVQSIEKELIADSTNMGEEEENRLSKLKPGEAYIYYSKLDTPQLVMTEDIREKEGIRLSVPNEEAAERATYWKEHLELLKPFQECSQCKYCAESCDFKVRSNADYIANVALEKYRASIRDAADIKKLIYHLSKLMKEEWDKYVDIDGERLKICTKIKLYRKCETEFPFRFSEKEKQILLYREPENSKEDKDD